MFVRLNKNQLKTKLSFLRHFIKSANSADGSLFDANANVASKNIAVLEAELNKDINIQVNRELVYDKIENLYDKDLADQYLKDIEDHTIYVHDESSLKPYSYVSSEAILVLRDNKEELTTFENLYESYDDIPETLVSKRKNIFAKFPTDLYIKDVNGVTKITRLLKKRNLSRKIVRVKTLRGEDILVTSNHPMIYDKNRPNVTIQAKDSLGYKQFKMSQEFTGSLEKVCVDTVLEGFKKGASDWAYYEDTEKNQIEAVDNSIHLNEDLGYFVGAFIGRGIVSKIQDDCKVVFFSDRKDIIVKLHDIGYNQLGLVGDVRKRSQQQQYVLTFKSIFLTKFLTEYLGISVKHKKRTLPKVLYTLNSSFIDGMLSGLIDIKANIVNDSISIVGFSRSLITQLSLILRTFDFGISNICIQNKEVSDRYYGIRFGLTGMLLFKSSSLVKKYKETISKKSLYLREGKIIKVAYLPDITEEEDFVYDITTESGQFLCNNLQVHNCTSVSMYPFLLEGLKSLGGESKAPLHIESFCGSFVNLVFAIASQFAGAVATVEFLMLFDYFARKDYGDDYLKTHKRDIENHLQHIIYCLNQPAAARGYQCVRSDTTSLMTPKGFKKLSELKEGDFCYVWKEGAIEIEPIKKLNVFDYQGTLLQFKGDYYQQTVTPNHRVLYKNSNTQEYDIKEAKDLFGRSNLSLPIASEKGIQREDYPIDDNLLKLCVVALTNGSIERIGNSGRLTVYKSKKRWGFKEIPAILDSLDLTYTVDSESNKGESFRLSKESSKIVLNLLNYTKKEIPSFFNFLSKRQIALVVDTWSSLDGSSNTVSEKILLQCANEKIQDSLQEILFLGGFGTEKYIRNTLYLKVFKRKDKKVSEYNEIEYTGKVWCPTTEAGVVIFREDNGVPYISGNSTFWNISIFDKHYFHEMFGKSFMFPDGTKPNWDSLDRLQKFFMPWFNKEREKAILTYPIVTAAALADPIKKTFRDSDFASFLAKEMSEGNSFFIYTSEKADSLSSCCRLRNEFTDNDFSYSLGAGGVATGSVNVITLNINRITQLDLSLEDIVDRVHKYHAAYRTLLEEFKENGLLPTYDAGYISFDKQFSTIGINGLVEAAEYLGIKVSNNKEYKDFVDSVLKVLYTKNKKMPFKCNTEFVPAENLGVKNAKWDKKSGLKVPRDCYNSYFYKVEDTSLNTFDKFVLHGREFVKFLDGGSALHLNLEESLTKDQYLKLLDLAVMTGCNYFCINVKSTVCNSCGFIDKRTLQYCSKCKSKDIDYATRVIGYLKKITSFSSERKKEESLRHYYHLENKNNN